MSEQQTPLEESVSQTGRRHFVVSEADYESLESSISTARGYPNPFTIRALPPLEAMPPARDNDAKTLIAARARLTKGLKPVFSDGEEVTVDDFTGLVPQPLPAVGEEVVRGMVYKTASGYHKCYQAHFRSEDSLTAPALFGPARAKGDVWVQPTGAQDAYPEKALVKHGGHLWVSRIPSNTTEPGSVGAEEYWLRVPTEIEGSTPDPCDTAPEWVSSDWGSYAVGFQVKRNGSVYEATGTSHTWIAPDDPTNGSISWRKIKDCP